MIVFHGNIFAVPKKKRIAKKRKNIIVDKKKWWFCVLFSAQTISLRFFFLLFVPCWQNKLIVTCFIHTPYFVRDKMSMRCQQQMKQTKQKKHRIKQICFFIVSKHLQCLVFGWIYTINRSKLYTVCKAYLPSWLPFGTTYWLCQLGGLL